VKVGRSVPLGDGVAVGVGRGVGVDPQEASRELDTRRTRRASTISPNLVFLIRCLLGVVALFDLVG
jgi:hypothetical protein